MIIFYYFVLKEILGVIKIKVPYSGEKYAQIDSIEICYDTFGEKKEPTLLLIMRCRNMENP